MSIEAAIDRALKLAGVPVVSVSFGDLSNKATWLVQPTNLQAQAQPIIDAFNPDDPAYVTAELDAEVKAELDEGRLASAIVWVILKQLYPADTDADTKNKFAIARTRIIGAYLNRPWT